MTQPDPQHVDALCGRIEQAMGTLFGDDQARVDHARAVLAYADQILAVEHGDRLIVRAAAILHDVGIQEAEFRVIWDADWLVNIPDEFPDATSDKLAGLIARVFRTETGRQLARTPPPQFSAGSST